MSQSIYLDYAAATPVDDRVLAAMQPYYQDQFYNPSATYSAARSAKRAIDDARIRVAAVLGAKPTEVVFTAGGTEANNLAILGLVGADDEALVSQIEHESVLAPAELCTNHKIKVNNKGQIDLDHLRECINDRTKLISIIYANNEIGTIQQLKTVVQLIEDVRRDRRQRNVKQPIFLHTDACQAANYLDLHVSRLGVDLMTINGGKIYGPKQSGVLYVRAGIELKPIIHGGGQEMGLRSGTENVAAVVGLAEAFVLAQAMRSEQSESLAKIQQHAVSKLTADFHDVVFNGHPKYRLVNNLHFTLPGQDNERLIFGLDDRGIMVAAGSACSASKEQPSHVLAALGISDSDARASLRVSFGRQTTIDQIDRFVDELKQIISS